MSGLADLLAHINSKVDEFLHNGPSWASSAPEFARDGRFTLGGLVAVLGLGASERRRDTPGSVSLSNLTPALVQTVLGTRVAVPVTADEAMEIVTLLRTGAIASDVASALQVVARFARRLPPELVIDLLRLPKLPGELVSAISADVPAAADRQPEQILRELRDGRIDWAAMPNTLRVLLSRAATRRVADTIRALVGPENRTIRLGILVYARAHGIDLNEDDLDALYQAIDPANPDLSPLLNQGLNRLISQFGNASDALAVLRKLKA